MTTVTTSPTPGSDLAERQQLVAELAALHTQALHDLPRLAAAVEQARELALEAQQAARGTTKALDAAVAKRLQRSLEIQRKQLLLENRLREIAPDAVRGTLEILGQLEEAVRQGIQGVPYPVLDRFGLIGGYEMGNDARERGEAVTAIRGAIARVRALAVTALPVSELNATIDSILREIDQVLFDAGVAERAHDETRGRQRP